MMAAESAPAEWKAPSEDGDLIIWPSPPELLEQTRQNQAMLSSCEARIQGVALRELRAAARKWIGHEDSRPLVATGHQVELYHPGVWAKDALINEVAAKLDGAAYHFAVDTDAPKHLYLRWPGGSEPITDDPALTTADWAGLLHAPTPGHVEEVRAEFQKAAAAWDFVPLLGEFLSSMKRLSMESSGLATNLVNAIHEIDWKLGLRHHTVVTSPIWQSPAYLAFAHHILARADEFASIYNLTLGEYRRQMGIRNPGRPWPDLKISDDGCEAPFWCDDLGLRRRSRSGVKRTTGGWLIQCAGDHGQDGRATREAFVLDPSVGGWEASQRLSKFLSAHGMRLSPRAMTLMMFLRLLVVDQFSHGIGGGRYDQITDRVIQRFFGIAPPGFSVTTATLLLPAAASQKLADFGALRTEGRRLRHGWSDPAKRDIARRIAQLSRRGAARQQLYFQMHERLADAIKRPPYTDWQKRFEQVQHLQAQQSELLDRELFFAIQSAERLKGLIARYHEQLA